MKCFMAVVFKMRLVRKSEFTDYWSNRQRMNTPWFRIIFSRHCFREILRAFRIVDKTIIPARYDSSYRQSFRLGLQLDNMI